MLTRRGWLFSSAALAASQAAQSSPKEVVIASGNGVRCCDKALEMIRQGADTLDAVVAGVTINEDDPGGQLQSDTGDFRTNKAW